MLSDGIAEPSLRGLLLRVAPEPLLLSCWSAFRELNIGEEMLRRLASALYGAPVTRLNGWAVSRPDKHGVRARYPDASNVADWCATLPAPTPNATSVRALQDAFAIMAHIVLSHPYDDGNGRLGRAMFQASLARSLGLHAPILPLGPGLHKRADRAAAPWCRLGAHGEWDDLCALYAEIIEEAVVTIKRLYAGA